GGPTNAAVHAPGDWSAESSEGWLRVTGGAGGLFPFDAPDTLIDPLAHADAEVPISPLSLMVSGASGSQLTLSALPNDTGVARTATVTVRSGNLPAQTLHITQQPVVTDISGPRVIECFNRRGYVDFLGASFVETGICGSVARVPIWDFVPISGSVNVFAIRNDSIGLYFTETGGNVRLAAGNGSNNQRWVLARQSNGTYRIRSVSNGMYMHNGLGSLTLANHVHTIDQQWRIEHIWHITNDGHQQNWIGFWDGAITVRTEPIPERQAAGFNFESRMTSAQTAWSNVLGVTFLPVVENAHIRAYGGDRVEIARLINNNIPFDPTNERYAAMTGRLRGGGEPASPIGQIIAGGATRNVFRLNDSLVDGVMRIGVFSNTGAWYTLNLRNIHFATMAATHELGHALGYMGHSPNLSDIMTGHIPGLASPNRTLNPAEIEHLLQVYRRRPWR
ncbi:MAG: RICIN domain-containing protein, partial [Oscillospiraceae bacterium]|nr:RICIN domain-containing protein [Oscillospiraceae bacterium]